MFPLKDNIPTDRFPLVTVALIVANALMYFLFQKGGILHGPSDLNVVHYGAIPYELTHPGHYCAFQSTPPDCSSTVASGQAPTYLTVLTSMFMHGSILHLAGNMLFLWIFGNNVEDSMGRVRFLAFYLLGGLAALGLQVLVDPGSAIPTLGASGAIAAVLGGYILLYPRARVVTIVFIVLFFGVIELPALALLGIWFAEQALLGLGGLADPAGGGGGVAYFAHVGGFVFGLALIRAFAQRRKEIPSRLPVY